MSKIHKEKSSFKMVDEEEEKVHPTPQPHVDDDEYNLQRGTQMSLEASQAHDQQAAKSLLELHKPKKQRIMD
ncbi:hypothetical protein Tco_0892750 [Tanacetum coccineum]|uniref:Uncharacterized protein n=1 Tax=Tanacetum coccineum TaxID=301880 RepID=A0ABQ5C9X6_9ASTR